MSSFRMASRVASRNLRVRSTRPQVRFETTKPHEPAKPFESTNSTNPAGVARPSGVGGSGSGGSSAGVVGGLTGGAAVFLAGYAYYHFSGTSLSQTNHLKGIPVRLPLKFPADTDQAQRRSLVPQDRPKPHS